MVSRRNLIRGGAAATLVAAGVTGALPTRSAFAAGPNWAQLQSKLSGTLVLPSQTAYATAKQISWMEFDSINPSAIAYCANEADVSQCLKFARANSIPATARSGGHGFLGYSLTTGLVIDVSRLKTVAVSGNNVVLGGGALQIDAVSGLAGSGLALPDALFPTVGAGGFIQGGGLGWQTRYLGVASDALTSARIVLADGSALTASAQQNSDLFWALRGGGGGNFGVVTSYCLGATAVPTMSSFNLSWTWDQAADVLNAWQQWAIAAPDQLSSGPVLALFDASPGAVPTVGVAGAWFGDPSALPAQVNALISAVGHPPASQTGSNDTFTTGMLNWYNCGNVTVSQCHMQGTTSDGQIPRFGWSLDRSRLFDHAIPAAGVDALLTAFDADRLAGHSRFVRGLVLGGKANQPSRTSTAYVHRGSELVYSVATGLASGTPSAADKTAASNWAAGTFNAIDPYSNGESYVNYLDATLTNYGDAYYKENLARLRRVKLHYDPSNFFAFAQSIR